MNSEKKYKEALNRAKILIEKLEANHIKGFIYHIFPELLESNEDRIKREILELVSIAGNGNQYEEIKYWLEKQNEQPTDNVESKFKVGDWVVRQDGENFCNGDYVIQITNITERGEYWFDSGSWLRAKDIRLWTIDDAKDGDVLWHSDSASNGIFIFKEIRHDGKVLCYCDYDSEDHFCTGEHHTCCWSDDKYIKPAKKEQSDLLFQKIKEAGYEWDAEKKEVKKIESLHIGEGLVKQVNEVHEYPIATKENIRKALMSISNKCYEELWKVTFGETYKEFVDKLLDN